jgi:GMP synthase (glutamine-hydrolysing)
MKSCVVLRHVAFEDLGVLAPILSRRSLRVQYLDLGIDEVERNEVEDSDLLVVLGGPIGVYQEDAYPFLLHELALISERLASLRPTLGICLGAS